MTDPDRLAAVRRLPAVAAMLDEPRVIALFAAHGRDRVAHWCRGAIDSIRQQILAGELSANSDSLTEPVLEVLNAQIEREAVGQIGRVVNATGVLLHTNLGRAPLAPRARDAAWDAAGYANVEIDLASGRREARGASLARLWHQLTGAPASLVVNNCAAATLLALSALARGKEVIVSRGQLIEIGGSFRLPDIFAESGARLREVGTTNRTRLEDYVNAIGPNTAALLRVHPSNFRVEGFTEAVGMSALAELAHQCGLLAIDDIGSGCLVDLEGLGLPPEPRVGASLAAGADLVLFSGDKLLGGPQAGILLGAGEVVARLAGHPLARAVRVDKLTLAALEATLQIHASGRAWDEIPVLRQLALPLATIEDTARALAADILRQCPPLAVSVRPEQSAVGGGSIPESTLATWVIAISPKICSAAEFARRLRVGPIRVIGRVRQDEVLLDPRTLMPDDEEDMVNAVLAAAGISDPA